MDPIDYQMYGVKLKVVKGSVSDFGKVADVGVNSIGNSYETGGVICGAYIKKAGK
jgi:hypothetical protein